jgi:hypothetical protein
MVPYTIALQIPVMLHPLDTLGELPAWLEQKHKQLNLF